jgi:Sigma-70, region 4
MAQTNPNSINYKQIATSALKLLRRDRDRQIISKRFGFGLTKRQTLEKIGQDYGITRERVRQIEKAATAKLVASAKAEVAVMDDALASLLGEWGGIGVASDVARTLGAETVGEQAYTMFLAELCESIDTIEENDRTHAGFGLLPDYSGKKTKLLLLELIEAVKTAGKPQSAAKLSEAMPSKPSLATVNHLAPLSKELSAA